jgi:hypothetical protein
MTTLKQAVNSKVQEMSPLNILLTVLVLGLLSGGGGVVAMGNLLGISGPQVVTIDQFETTLTELNSTLRTINRTLNEQRSLLQITRCEIQRQRDGLDFRDCWNPESEQ